MIAHMKTVCNGYKGQFVMTSTAGGVTIGPTFGSRSRSRKLSNTGFYVPEIDGLRAIAVGTVMIYHLNFSASLLPGGFVGVDIFFVISGYVVSASLGRDAGLSLLDLLQRFYSRRILRIVPALLTCLLATIAASILFIPPNAWLIDTNYKTALYAFFGMSNFVLLGAESYFSPGPEFNPFTHTWSLAVEEQFYLFFPLIFFVWSRFKDRTGVVGLMATGLLTGLSIVSFIFMWWMSGVNQDAAFYLLPSRFWELGIGAILFQVQCSGKSPVASATHARRALTSGTVLVLVAALFADRLAFPFPWAVPAAVGALLIIAAVSTERASPSPVARVLRSQPMVFVGKISYSLYLWHWPVYTLMRWTVGLEGPSTMIMAVGLSLVFAYLSYTVLERPIRRAGWIVRPKSLIVVGGLAAMVLSWETARVAIGKQYRLSLSVVQRDITKWFPNWANTAGCPLESATEAVDGTSIFIMRPGQGCSGLPRRHLFVVGDSHGWAYMPMLSLLAGQDSIDVRLYTHFGCSPANLLRPSAPNCASYHRASVNDIGRRAAAGDVVFLPALRMNRLSEQSVPFTVTHVADLTTSAQSDTDRRLAYEEAAELIGEFSKKGLRVIIEAPKPVFKAHAFRCSDWFNAGNPLCRGGLTIGREELLEYRKPVMNSLAALSSIYPQLVVWDPFPILCPQDPCRAVTETGPLFFDGDHLSGAANHLLYPHFLQALRQVWAAQG
jgi:peptidoglycan/LPS O-acetylase OafA/YrhL